ncbi:MAG: FecR domain-containing protein [Gammaproteobacteria bacterium]
MYKSAAIFSLVAGILLSFQIHAAVPIGKVIAATGKVIAENNGDSRSLARGSGVFVGDKISTGPQGSAHIRFSDNTLVSIEKQSIFVLNEYIYNEQNPKVNKQTSSLLQGGFKTITGLISKGDYTKYKVNTPVSTIGVRSTEYLLFLRKVNEKWVLWMSVIKGTGCAESYGKCFSSNSDTPNARVTDDGAEGYSEIDISEWESIPGDEKAIVEVDLNDGSIFEDPEEGTTIDQGDIKGLEQDFTRSFSPAAGGGVPSRDQGFPGNNGTSGGEIQPGIR